MSEKLTLSELRSQVAARSGISEKEVGLFLAALMEQIKQGLKNDQQVKISGLGTFRLQAVAPRKSVNVSSGESFIIEGYNKILFSSEAGMKELLQATNSAEEEMTPLKRLGEQAIEIVDILAELGQKPEEEPGAKNQEQGTPEAPEETEEPKEEPKEQGTPEETEKQEPEKQKYHFLRDLTISVVILIALLLAGFYFAKSMLTDWIGEIVTTTTTVEEQGTGNQELGTGNWELGTEDEEQGTKNKEEGTRNQEQGTPEEAEEPATENRVYTEFITTEEMHQDSRLAWMAYRYYGNKDLWVYIYDANRDRIKNPNYIEVGTPIRVPKLRKEQMDTTNPDTQREMEAIWGGKN